MKLGPLLLLSLLLHGVLLLALHAAPPSPSPAPPPVPPLVWLHLAPPAPAVPAAPAAPATAEPIPPAAPAVAARLPIAVGASLPSQRPVTAHRARPAPPLPAAPDQSDPGVDIPIEAEAGALTSASSASARAIPGAGSAVPALPTPGSAVPALPGPLQTGAPPAAPASPPFDARAYADSIRRRIDAEKQYPARARRLGLQGVATVLVAVDSRGRLIRPPRLARTSGVAALDHEALRMVQAAAPFMPPAGAAPHATPLEVQVPVRFSLADAP